MTIKESLDVLAGWIEERTREKRYPEREVKELSKALLNIRDLSEVPARSENKKAGHVGKADHDPDDLFFEENRKSILPELRGKTVKEKPDDEILLMRL